MTAQFITIGKIVNTQGHRGNVRVIPLTEFPERFMKLKEVWVERKGSQVKMHVEQAFAHKKFIILKFREVENMNEAERLKGSLVKIPREDVMELPPGHYYVFDIVGLRVFDVSGEYLGEISDVLQTGANDVYVVEKEKQKPLLVPALKDVVKKINIEEKEMIVELPEGLREL
ncbi:MAG: 16S rRNA processing protein RimM [Peptococcaceae bacterium]|nr:16S rRNA processing protein RimM [Peptococcaceae bacterium]